MQYNKMHINAIEAMDRLSVGAAADGGYFDFISTEYGMGVKWRAVQQSNGVTMNAMRAGMKLMARRAAEYIPVEDEDGVFKVSVRTDRSVNAAEYCAMFGGGGHAEAAGCTVKGTLDEAKAQLKKAAEGVL